MADWIFDFYFFGGSSIRKEDLHSIGDGTFVRFEVFAAVAGVFANCHLLAQGIDSRIFCRRLFVMIGSQCAEEQPDGGHVLQTMVPVSWIVERAFLVNDSNCRFLGCDDDLTDFIEPIANLR